MKKYLGIFILGLFLMSVVSAGSWTHYDDGQWADEYSSVTGMYPECEGIKYGSYCVGKYYIDVSHSGDQFRIIYKSDNWMVADENGFTNGQPINDGRIYLAQNGRVPRYHIGAWDYDKASNGDWGWVYTVGGYLGTGYFGLYEVECYGNSDCSSNEFCNKDGDWENWKCDLRICNEGESRCFGSNLQKCEGNQWIDKWVVLNECDVECLDDSNCPADQVSDKFCSGDNIMETQTDHYCFSNYKCLSSTQDVILDTCSFKCEEIEGEGAICIQKICDEGSLMCSDEENALMCQNNKWTLKEECEYGCEEGACKSFYTTNTFYGIVAGVVISFIALIISVFVFTSKRK